MSKQINGKDIQRLLLRVYYRYIKGEITEAQATKEKELLNSILKAIEVTDIEQRLEALETITGMEIR